MAMAPDAAGLRGDYAAADEHYVVPQDWARYTPAEHDRWRRLYRRQSAIVPRHASRAVLDALSAIDTPDAIPRFDAVSEQLGKATGWSLVAVPGLLPNEVFFAHLAARRFPITRWLREEAELDYIVEPDIFHDFFGHVPLLFQPAFADGMQQYGVRGAEAERLGQSDRLSRLYWYVVEFGLERTPDGLKAFGAGILSSAAETVFSTTSTAPRRVRFDLRRVLRTRYRIDDLQELYFVLDDLRELLEAVEKPLEPLYRELAGLADIEPGALAAGDVQIAPDGQVAAAA